MSSRTVIGDTSVEVQGADTIIANLGTMTMPGAYVELGVTVCNRGTSSATLASVTKGDCDLEDIEVRFPGLEAGEVLDPGETCTFTLVVIWSADSVLQYEEEATGSFSLLLHYEGDTTKTPGEDDDPAGGGDDSSDGSDPSDGDGSSYTAADGSSGEDDSSNGVAESPSNGSDSSGSTTEAPWCIGWLPSRSRTAKWPISPREMRTTPTTAVPLRRKTWWERSSSPYLRQDA